MIPLWLVVVGCTADRTSLERQAPGPTEVTSPPVDSTDTTPHDTGVTETGPTDTEPKPGLSAPDHLALPYVVAGAPAPEGEVEVTLVEVSGTLDVTVEGEFSAQVVGDGSERTVEVVLTADTMTPAIHTGSMVVTVDEHTAVVGLAAVIGDASIAEAFWTEDPWGSRAVVALPSAPYPHPDGPYTDDSVLVFVPHGLSDRGDLNVVAHMHGHNAVLEDVVADQYIVEQHALSGRDAVLIVPQGPVSAADSDFGRLDEAGAFGVLVRDVVSVLYRDGWLTRPVTGRMAVTSHSGGYAVTANILEHGGLPVHAAHLFDSLYAEEQAYADHALGGGVLRSVYTASGGTSDENVYLDGLLHSSGLVVSDSFSDEALDAHPVTIGATSASHSGCVYDQRAFARWLTASGLTRNPSAPPELLTVDARLDPVTVAWRADTDGRGGAVVVEGSADGETWTTLGSGEGERAEVPSADWVRIRYHDPDLGLSEPSDAYPGGGGEWLVVDAFDRVLDGSWGESTHTFAASLGATLGAASGASNEAIASGEVAMTDFDRVLWMLGDESTLDHTFDAAEREAIEVFLDAGGQLVVSGSEVGYATDAGWLSSVLGVSYVSDDAGTDRAGGYTFGVAYEEDYPDVLGGDAVIWSYDTGGAAAVGSGPVIVVGFPLETLAPTDMPDAIGDLVAWLDGSG